jgi:hypothetical protein
MPSKVSCAHADSCNLEMQLCTEEVEAEAWAALPPTGALRNLALKLANTEVLLPPIAQQEYHYYRGGNP